MLLAKIIRCAWYFSFNSPWSAISDRPFSFPLLEGLEINPAEILHQV